jgi:hypothetical protein
MSTILGIGAVVALFVGYGLLQRRVPRRTNPCTLCDHRVGPRCACDLVPEPPELNHD